MSSSSATPHAQAARDEKRRGALALGIDEGFVSDLVDRFYGLIRSDAQLGPIFANKISEWDPHLAQMKRFWRSILFSSGEFFGNPMLKHLAIPQLAPAHFERWLELFDKALGEIAADAAREHVLSRARLIAGSLMKGVAGRETGAAAVDGQGVA